MRALAAKWDLDYRGPTMPRFLGFELLPPSPSHLPHSFPRPSFPRGPIRHVWNLIQGQLNGRPVFVCDTIIYYRTFCTIIACQVTEDPYTPDQSDDVIRFGGWQVLSRRSYYRPIPWTISIADIDRQIASLHDPSPAPPSTEMRPPN